MVWETKMTCPCQFLPLSYGQIFGKWHPSCPLCPPSPPYVCWDVMPDAYRQNANQLTYVQKGKFCDMCTRPTRTMRNIWPHELPKGELGKPPTWQSDGTNDCPLHVGANIHGKGGGCNWKTGLQSNMGLGALSRLSFPHPLECLIPLHKSSCKPTGLSCAKGGRMWEKSYHLATEQQ